MWLLLLLLGSADVTLPIEEPNYTQWTLPENYTGPYTYVAPFTCKEEKSEKGDVLWYRCSSFGHTRCEAKDGWDWQCEYIEHYNPPDPNPTWEYWMGGEQL